MGGFFLSPTLFIPGMRLASDAGMRAALLLLLTFLAMRLPFAGKAAALLLVPRPTMHIAALCLSGLLLFWLGLQNDD
jgi:hypothetical protein